ncbi:MAG: ATP-dependent DNA helicase [Gammaproteobacteria bacterium]
MNEHLTTLGDLFASHGPIADLLPGYTPRSAQLAMAESVERALAQRDTLVCEAGTGTGKTFAYLVPVLRSGLRTLLSTGTKNLQDQLFHRDLPKVKRALGLPVRAVLLKGRSNYLCRHRLALSASEGRFRSREDAHRFQEILAWSERTREGDIAEVTSVAEDSALWPRVTSTPDNCLGQECDHYRDCFVHQARQRALEADVVVINHHLLFADLALRETGFGELLPQAEAIVIDEAHQIPETAASYFGLSVTGRQLLELVGDTRTEQIREAADADDLVQAAERLERPIRELRLSFGVDPQRGAWDKVRHREAVQTALAMVGEGLAALEKVLAEQAARSKGLENCWRRSQELAGLLDQVTGATPEGYVQWFETTRHGFVLHMTPLDVAEPFRAYLQAGDRAWVFTSATLAVGSRFDHFVQRIGLNDFASARWESPFDYARQGLLYLPQALPDPNTPGYTQRVVDTAVPVLEASGGRAFLLFTSHRALREARQQLEGRIDYPLLVQGEAPKGELLDRFRSAGNAVLLGTSSFWEGVDVRGPALSCVIIDRLPFASPGDPVLEARIRALREAGRNPFMEYQVPQAVIGLKQGVGRLIRDESDSGVLVLCDPRLTRKHYGRLFLESLPPMPVTDRLEEVQRFYDQLAAKSTGERAVV